MCLKCYQKDKYLNHIIPVHDKEWNSLINIHQNDWGTPGPSTLKSEGPGQKLGAQGDPRAPDISNTGNGCRRELTKVTCPDVRQLLLWIYNIAFGSIETLLFSFEIHVLVSVRATNRWKIILVHTTGIIKIIPVLNENYMSKSPNSM